MSHVLLMIRTNSSPLRDQHQHLAWVDRHIAIQAWIVRLPHLSDSTGANRGEDFVGTKFIAGGNRH